MALPNIGLEALATGMLMSARETAVAAGETAVAAGGASVAMGMLMSGGETVVAAGGASVPAGGASVVSGGASVVMIAGGAIAGQKSSDGGVISSVVNHPIASPLSIGIASQALV